MGLPVILLVEDTASDEKLTIRALSEAKIANEVVVARDGAAALDYLFARGAHRDRDVAALPQVVLLDLNLPKVSGLDVLRAIRADARMRMLPVVILTSSRQDRDVLDGYELGANSYITKPVDYEKFREAVRLLGLYWIVLNELPPRSGSTD